MGSIVMLLGLVALRLCPVIYGFYLVNKFGHIAYSSFVLFISYCNALVAFPVMGVTPHILRAGSSVSNYRKASNISFYGFIAIFVFALTIHLGMFFIGNQDVYLENSLANLLLVVIYSLGIGGQSIVSAILNSQKKNKEAGFFSLIVGIVSLICGVFFGAIFNYYGYSLLFFCIAFFITVFTGFWVFNIKDMDSFSVLFKKKSWSNVKNIIRGFGKYLASGAFGALILFGIYYLNKMVQINYHADAGIFSLSLQMFAISIFIPGALGSVLTPKLLIAIKAGNIIIARKLAIKYFLFYMGIGCVLIGVFFMFLSLLLQQYKISVSLLNIKIFLIVQVAGCLASMNAALNQLAVAFGKFYYLFASSLIWLLMVIFIYNCVGRNALAAAYALAIAYVVTIASGIVLANRNLRIV